MTNKKTKKNFKRRGCDTDGCGEIHYNRKYDLCNICLKKLGIKKKCYSSKCIKLIDKDFRYCFDCYNKFQPKSIDLPKGICLID